MATSVRVLIPYYSVCFLVLLVFGCLRLMLKIFFLRRFAIKLFKVSSGMNIPEEDYKDSLFGWEMYKAVIEAILLDMTKSTRPRKAAPNPSVIALDGNRRCSLLDFARDSRPLVINFGSCTCPIFMAGLHDFGETIKEFGDVADFLVIYVEEAHPTDGWAFKVPVQCMSTAIVHHYPFFFSSVVVFFHCKRLGIKREPYCPASSRGVLSDKHRAFKIPNLTLMKFNFLLSTKAKYF